MPEFLGPFDRCLNPMAKSKSRTSYLMSSHLHVVPPTSKPGLQSPLIGDCPCDSSLWSQLACMPSLPLCEEFVRFVALSQKSSALLHFYGRSYRPFT
ncbi:hypothetical protein BDR04DRAFT_1107118 [Suillus decipiens]|nr:hypothetical protein BDR04DRAFT_1107118 [Suillus decipiens]